MKIAVLPGALGLAIGALAAWAAPAAAPAPIPVPAGWPAPHYRFEHNTPTAAGIELGRRLFYDPQLSADGRIACASCHQQSAAFAHPHHRLSHGIGDQLGTRNAPGLFNLAWQPDFMWDGAVNHLELQPLAPLTNPVEMGATLPEALARLRADPQYAARFEAAFGTPAIDSQRLLRALAQFLGSLVSANSAYDRAQRGEAPLGKAAQRGLTVFRARCAACHAEPFFTDFGYRNNGLDLVPQDPGRGAITGRVEDRGRFRVPSLRNVALSAPYMHDGRFETLDAVLDHYARGLRHSPSLDPELATPRVLEAADRQALVAFLNALTDERFVRDARFADPREADAPSHPAPEARWTALLGRWLEDRLTSPAQALTVPVLDARTTLAAPPRIARRLTPFEIVAVRDRDALRVWVDDELRNTPREGLDLRLRLGSHLMRSVEEAPGRYRVPVDAVLPPGAAVLELRAADSVEAHRLAFDLPAVAPD